MAQSAVMEGREARRAARRRARRRRLLTRAAPFAVLAIVAFVLGIIVSTGPARSERHLVSDYVNAWARDEYGRMYSLLDRGSRRRIGESGFIGAYQQDATTATLLSITPGRIGGRQGSVIPVQVIARTRLFGRLRETLTVPLVGSGSGASVRYSGTLLFPGLKPGDVLTRQDELPPRATLFASNGTPLAQGPDRSTPIPDVASGIVGTLGPIPAAEDSSYLAQGYPPNAKVGIDGLERIFQGQLAGTPGGMLFAGSRVLARRSPVPGHDVTTTINPSIERAMITAMGNNYAGMAAMDPRTGAVLGLAGIAFSNPQPPGSTMKIITATGALEAGIVKLSDTFPIMTAATIDGYTLQNASGEACGGTFLNAFAVSCNSVFAPLGAKLGGSRLVNIAERFGFNSEPSIPGAAESMIPPANQIGDSLAVGSSAIGQGKVETTPLEMTDVAATIAMGGRRPIPTLQAGQAPRFVTVTNPGVAGQVQRMMVAVVQFGTGTSAQIPGVQVAGKTGTAELTDTADPNNPNAGSAQNTDAWFVGYAPVGAPRIVVGALYPNQGAGGATAAPPVHDVLAAALQSYH